MRTISHPLGALYNTHHGLTNAVVMPMLLEFNRVAIDERMTRLADSSALANPGFKAVQDWILALRREIKILYAERHRRR